MNLADTDNSKIILKRVWLVFKNFTQVISVVSCAVKTFLKE
jgi:hypothetical protein